MKTVLHFMFVVLLFMTIGYFLGAVATGNWDILHWPTDARGVYVVSMIFIIFLIIVS